MSQYPVINSSYQGIQGFVSYANDVSGGVLMPFFLLALYIIMIVSQLAILGFQRALLVSGFVVSILSIMMSIMGYLAPMYMYLSFILVGLSAILVRLNFN